MGRHRREPVEMLANFKELALRHARENAGDDLPLRVIWGRHCEMARETGLEPATSGVTGRRSNQLSYSPASPALRQ